VVNESDVARASDALLTVKNVAFVEPVVAGQKKFQAPLHHQLRL